LIVSSQEFPSPFPPWSGLFDSPRGERDGVRGFKSLVKGAILKYNGFRIHNCLGNDFANPPNPPLLKGEKGDY